MMDFAALRTQVIGWCPSIAVIDKAHVRFIVPLHANTLWHEGAKS
jgi:hypothetical protein